MLQRARKLVAEAGQHTTALYRGAIHQRAARNAYGAGRCRTAVHLMLVARRKAPKVIQGNKGQLKGANAIDSADETASADEAGTGVYIQAVERENIPEDSLTDMVLKPTLQ